MLLNWKFNIKLPLWCFRFLFSIWRSRRSTGGWRAWRGTWRWRWTEKYCHNKVYIPIQKLLYNRKVSIVCYKSFFYFIMTSGFSFFLIGYRKKGKSGYHYKINKNFIETFLLYNNDKKIFLWGEHRLCCIVFDIIWYQIRTPGTIISLHGKFGPNQSNFGKTDSRNPAT